MACSWCQLRQLLLWLFSAEPQWVAWLRASRGWRQPTCHVCETGSCLCAVGDRMGGHTAVPVHPESWELRRVNQVNLHIFSLYYAFNANFCSKLGDILLGCLLVWASVVGLLFFHAGRLLCWSVISTADGQKGRCYNPLCLSCSASFNFSGWVCISSTALLLQG